MSKKQRQQEQVDASKGHPDAACQHPTPDRTGCTVKHTLRCMTHLAPAGLSRRVYRRGVADSQPRGTHDVALQQQRFQRRLIGAQNRYKVAPCCRRRHSTWRCSAGYLHTLNAASTIEMWIERLGPLQGMSCACPPVPALPDLSQLQPQLKSSQFIHEHACCQCKCAAHFLCSPACNAYLEHPLRPARDSCIIKCVLPPNRLHRQLAAVVAQALTHFCLQVLGAQMQRLEQRLLLCWVFCCRRFQPA